MPETKDIIYQNRNRAEAREGNCVSSFSTGGCGESWDASGITMEDFCDLPEEERQRITAVLLQELESSLTEEDRQGLNAFVERIRRTAHDVGQSLADAYPWLENLGQKVLGCLQEASGQDVPSWSSLGLFREYGHMKEVTDIDEYMPKAKPEAGGKITIKGDITIEEVLRLQWLCRHRPLTGTEFIDLQKSILQRKKEAEKDSQVPASDAMEEINCKLDALSQRIGRQEEQDSKIATLTKTIEYQDKLIARNDEYVTLQKEHYERKIEEATAQAKGAEIENMLYELLVKEERVLEYTGNIEKPYKIATGKSGELRSAIMRVIVRHKDDMPLLKYRKKDFLSKVLAGSGKPISDSYWDNLTEGLDAMYHRYIKKL